MATALEQLVAELRQLRQRRGLTLQALAEAPAVLTALGTTATQEAYDLLLQHIQALGDDEPAQALQNAYALDQSMPGVLTDRRHNLHLQTGRDPKTLAVYENAMIDELATRLLSHQPTELSDSEVIVVAYVHGLHIKRVTVTVRFPVVDEHDIRERTVDYENRAAVSSMPVLLYQLPPDWLPRQLTLAVHFVEPPFPAQVLGTAATGLRDLMFADHGQVLPVGEEHFVNIQIAGPKAAALYAIYWTG